MINKITKLIELNKETIGINFKFDESILEGFQNSLNIIIKKRYRKYWTEDPHLHIKFKDDMTIRSIECSCHKFFGMDYVTLYGVKYEDGEFTYTTFTDKIYNFLDSSGDKELSNFNSLVDELNSFIKKEIDSFLSKDSFYDDVFSKYQKVKLLSDEILSDMNNSLSRSGIFLKTASKVNAIFSKDTYSYSFKYISLGYDKFEVGVCGKCDSYADEGLCNISRDNYYIGTLLFENGKFKFEPSIRNQKYISNRVSSIRFMRQTFKNHLVKAITS